MTSDRVEERAQHALRELETWVRARDYAGYDAYDALRSPLLRLLTRPHPYLRMAVIQVFRRSPINLRPLVGVRRGRNPKGMGLFLAGYVKLQAAHPDEPAWAERVERVRTWLLAHPSPGHSGFCWGYNFDWQSRVFFLPEGTPTVVNTAFVAQAFLDRFELLGDEEDLSVARGAAEFVLRDLNRTLGERGSCFSYTPLDHTVVHNANLLGAALLARVYSFTGEEELAGAARESVAYSMHLQRPDGSWYYADTPIQRWIDGFHTGFNLDSIQTYVRCTGDSSPLEGLERGLAYYVENFFLDDATPKYYHDRMEPLDIHSPAQALVTLTRFGYTELAERVVDWVLEHMRDPSGYFYFRVGRLSNRIPYIRWAQAWMFHALAWYLHGAVSSGRSLTKVG